MIVTAQQPTVFIIDDDASVRDGIEDLLRSVGLGAQSFRSTEEFLQSRQPDLPGLDVRLPGASGLEFQRTPAQARIQLPVIFISGHGDIPISVRAMQLGVIEFLTKPRREQALLDAVNAELEHDRARRKQAEHVAELRQRFDTFTTYQLKLSENTVEVHRWQDMQKMRARSLVELVRMVSKLGVSRKLLRDLTVLPNCRRR
jgi:FixJ family two-component response regulator